MRTLNLALYCVTAVVSVLAVSFPAQAVDLIVSANDGKFVRVDGRGTYPENPLPDTLLLIDATTFPPKVAKSVEVQHSIHGPPQAVAITPDERLAFVSSPDSIDYHTDKRTLLHFIQVVDLEPSPPRVIERVDVGSHPQGLAVSPDGRLLLAATTGGYVAVLSIDGKRVSLAQKVSVGKGKLAGVSFTHDGKSALVANRDEQGIAVLDIDAGKLVFTTERVSTGVTPYGVDVSTDGRWAVVSNAGLSAISDSGKLFGDVDSVTLIDVSKKPFRAVQHLTVPAVPEGVAISSDGRWIAAICMDGSNLTKDNPGRKETGTIVLFEIRDGRAHRVDDAPSGVGSQGAVFTADSQYLLVQLNVEKQIGVWAVKEGTLEDTGERIEVPGGPTSIRSKPR